MSSQLQLSNRAPRPLDLLLPSTCLPKYPSPKKEGKKWKKEEKDVEAEEEEEEAEEEEEEEEEEEGEEEEEEEEEEEIIISHDFLFWIIWQ